MSKDGKSAIIAAIITGVCALLVGVLGTLVATSITNNTQTVVVNVNGAEVEVNKDEIQSMLARLEAENKQLKTENESLAENGGYDKGKEDGYSDGYSKGKEDGYAEGYEKGKGEIPDPPAPDPDGETTTKPPPAPKGGTALFSVNDIPLVNSVRWDTNTGDLNDSLGNTYTPKNFVVANSNWAAYSSSSAEYNVRQNFTKLLGRFAPHETHNDHETLLKIYADGRLIYTSPKITRTTYPIDLPNDVTFPKETKIIKIEITGSNLLLLDFTLS